MIIVNEIIYSFGQFYQFSKFRPFKANNDSMVIL